MDALVIPPFIAFAKLSHIMCGGMRIAPAAPECRKIAVTYAQADHLISVPQNRTDGWLERLNPSSSGTATGEFFVVGLLTVLNGGEP